MHPLMKLTEIAKIKLPGFRSAYNKSRNENLTAKTPKELEEYLLKQPDGTANMLFLKSIDEGKMSWTYKKRPRRESRISEAILPRDRHLVE